MDSVRITQLPTKSAAGTDDYIAVDSTANGTKKIQFPNLLDNGLTIQNKAADAKATGDAISAVNGAVGNEASARQSADANLQTQIDQLIAPSGEAPSAAEIENARIGAPPESTVYSTLGDAIRGQFTDLKSDIGTFFNGEYIQPTLTFNNGFVSASTGEINNHSAYRYSQLIPVNEGDVVEFKSGGTVSVLTLAQYSSADGNADISASIVGMEFVYSTFVPILSGIKYIRLTTTSTDVADSYVRIYSETNALHQISKDYFNDDGGVNVPAIWESGYINTSGVKTANNSYRRTKPIAVKSGEKYKVTTTASSSVLAVSMISAESSTVVTDLSMIGTGVALDEYTFYIPNNISHIIISIARTAFAGMSITRIEETKTNMSESIEMLKTSKASDEVITKRKGSVSFIFDDGDPNDSLAVRIFNAHGKKCGFAVYEPISDRYSAFHSQGFEILAHADSPLSNPTEESVRELLKTSYDNVVDAVGACDGWVTPNSVLSAEFQPLVYDYYKYGFTIYKGNVSNPSQACMDLDRKSYTLWRSSLESLTLEQQKAIVDYAVENNLIVCFYGHMNSTGSSANLTAENLNELLSYCDTVGISVKTPYKSISDFFAYHHNEDTDLWTSISPSDANLSSKLQISGTTENYWDMRYSKKLRLFVFTARLKATENIASSEIIATIPVRPLQQGVVVTSESDAEVLLYNGNIIYNGSWSSGTSYRFHVVCAY